MFLSPRSNIDEYWSNSEMLGNTYVKKIFSRDTFNHYYLSISWEEDDNNQSDNWFQKQIINTIQNQIIVNHIENSGLNQILWNIPQSEQRKEFPFLHLPIHSDAFQKTMLQQKQQTKYYNRVLKQEQPLTEKQVKNINQMKTQDEHYKQLIAYIPFEHKILRLQTRQFIYCLQVCIINSFLIFRYQYALENQPNDSEDNEQRKQQQKLGIRDFVQLLIESLEPLITTNQQDPYHQILKLQSIVKQNELFVPMKQTKVKISASILKIMQNHHMIPIRQIRTNVKDPIGKCCMCEGKTRFICSCNQHFCQSCHAIHMLIEQEQSQNIITQIQQLFQ
ncbi:Hypothetical_protein [Hexamita inflata]|uniref:Hypothetical_protein n=1 Tax=Hexamita inflata TaxID=28002 RepID=A0AA86N400_9EUKA|nr:Hypothetical protein HINF_LOCUS222 [Hexamita inflata]